MPKRVIDGEGLWRSEKLSRVEPVWMRAELANLLPLSLANGVFEADPRRIWSLVYSYNRPEISPEDVGSILAEYNRVGLFFRWVDRQTAKEWGYWVGIEKTGRLPSPSRLARKHEAIGPKPPDDDLKTFILQSSSQWLAKGEGGFGLGFGIGPGSEEESPVSHAPVPVSSPPDLCEQIVAIWNRERGLLPKVLKLTDQRRRKISARMMADPNFPATFAAAVQKASGTPFLCGAGSRGWRSSFDWILDETNLTAVLEGKYDSAKGGSAHAEQQTGKNLTAVGLRPN